MKTIIIAAIARNGVIGRTKTPCDMCEGAGSVTDPTFTVRPGRACGQCGGSGYVLCNDLPWSYPEDMAHFKDATMGHAVVMGRKTWESLPAWSRPLPGRTNIVVSKTWAQQKNPGVAAVFVPDFASARWAADRREHEKLYVIGGAQLYADALPLADALDLTLIDKDFEGDVYFPTRQLALDTVKSFGWDEPDGGYRNFDCVERRPGTTPELTFTKWVRR